MPPMLKFSEMPLYSVFLSHGLKYLKVSDSEAAYIRTGTNTPNPLVNAALIQCGGIGIFRPDDLYEVVGYAQFIKN